jgi:hypothetical protein
MSNFPAGWNEDCEEDEPTMSSQPEMKGDVQVSLSSHALEHMAKAVEHAVVERLVVLIERAVTKKMNELVDEAVRKVIGDRAEALVIAAIEKPRQKFDMWGNPTGPTVAFADIIPGVVESYLSQKVNDKGDLYSGTVPRVNWIIGQHVKAHVDPAVQNAVSSVTKQARDIVTAKVSAFVAEQMVPAIDVQKIGRA